MLTATCGRLVDRFLQRLSARLRAEILFAMRISPPAFAFMLVGVFLIPSYVGYEPDAPPEAVSKKLAGLALISMIGVVFALWRGFRSWFATNRLARKWLAIGERINLRDVSIPTYGLAHPFPVIAVVGTIRPRLFVAKRVLEALTAEELLAAIAHERGHLAGRDNLKRSLLRLCRDMLMIVPCGRSLDRAWAEAAECAADENAAEENATTALNLASALVKIARMIPAGARATMPVASYLIGVEEARGVKARIRRLLEIAARDRKERVNQRTIVRILPVTGFGMLGLLVIIIATNPRVLLGVHAVVETAVALIS